jgi:NAD(P)-dependent dehydrogenase (short-subunit alcohol dehydrogenase family)
MSRLIGKTALVTGSTDGIGAAIAEALAAEGAYVIVTGRRPGTRTVERIKEAGGDARYVTADLGAGGKAIQALVDEAGPVDILVNNAAMLLTPTPTAEVPEELIDDAFAVSVKAVFLLTGMVAPAMAERGGGVIVNMGSIAGVGGSAGSALYNATKATVHSLTKSFAQEYGPLGVRINTIAPGPTFTDRIAKIKDHLRPMIDRTPSRRANTPEEVARAVVFMVSEEAANIHGATLMVDGGLTTV